MTAWFFRTLDLRDGERRAAAESFFLLFLIIAGHTVLETARDALFLTRLPPQQLNLVYIALAGFSFFSASGITRLGIAYGRRRALVATLVLSAVVTAVLQWMHPTRALVMGLYVFSGLVGAALSTQFWLLAAQRFNSAQARRLFGPIASGGVVGAVAGAGSAALLLSRIAVTSLLAVSAIAFALAAAMLVAFREPSTPPDARTPPPQEPVAQEPATPSMGFTAQPFAWRLGILVALSTAATLTLDYLFKSTAARTVPVAHLGTFFARYYALMNVVSFAVQVLFAGRVVQRLGVVRTTAIMPLLLFGGGVASWVFAGASFPVFGTRVVDGGLRHSLNRVATELLYLPLPEEVRQRAKGFIDTVLTRSVQAITAGGLFLLSTFSALSPRLLSLMVIVESAAWFGVAIRMRRSYIDLFRQALAGGGLALDSESLEIDVNAAEALVETMASPDPKRVVAAINVLNSRKHMRLVPALILYHDANAVLFRALEIFGDSQRKDWIPLGERLLSHDDETVRVAAVRALAKHGVESALQKATEDASSMVRGYAALYLARRARETDLAKHPLIAQMLTTPGEVGEATRRVLLTAIADTPDSRAAALLLAIIESPSFVASEESISLVARAVEVLRDPRFLPFCIGRLGARPGRERIRLALVAIGEKGLIALENALTDSTTARRVRTHIPRTISRFGSQHAADFLVRRLLDETDGFVRYKVLRGLGYMVRDYDIKVDSSSFGSETKRNLLEYLRALTHRVNLEVERPTDGPSLPSEQLLMGLLYDKQRQALERAFRLLQLVFRREDIHRVHIASTTGDKLARSNASEFLDSLLAGPRNVELRDLFQVVMDDLGPTERAARAAPFLGTFPHSRQETLDALVQDHDDAVSSLATYYVRSHERLSVPAVGPSQPASELAVQPTGEASESAGQPANEAVQPAAHLTSEATQPAAQPTAEATDDLVVPMVKETLQ